MKTSAEAPVRPFRERLESSSAENLRLSEKLSSLSNENLELKEKLNWLLKQVFGKRSERVVNEEKSGQSQDPETATTQTVRAHERKKRRPTGADAIVIPEDLPVEVTVIDLPEEEKICKETGELLQKIGEEVTHKLAYRPGSYFLKKIVRPKYAHPGREEKGIFIASLPDSLLPKCKADESLLAEIATRKFADHLPLNRIAEGFARERVRISRRLLSNWIVSTGLALILLYETMKSRVLEGTCVHIDESPVKIFENAKMRQGYMWVVVGGEGRDPPYRVYNFYEDRKHIRAQEILGSYSGVIHSDKYEAYKAYVESNGNRLSSLLGAYQAPFLCHRRNRLDPLC